jgi:hypothetical protein
MASGLNLETITGMVKGMVSELGMASGMRLESKLSGHMCFEDIDDV